MPPVISAVVGRQTLVPDGCGRGGTAHRHRAKDPARSTISAAADADHADRVRPVAPTMPAATQSAAMPSQQPGRRRSAAAAGQARRRGRVPRLVATAWVAGELHSGLNRIWAVPPRRNGDSVRTPLSCRGTKERPPHDVEVIRDLRCPGLRSGQRCTVADGACAAITGPSGSGKSRILRAIADLDPNTGTVSPAASTRSRVPAPVWRRRVRFVAAEPAWWGGADRRAFPPAPRSDADGRAGPAAGLPGLAGGTGIDRPAPAPGADPRRWLDAPAVLLLDEPTGGAGCGGARPGRGPDAEQRLAAARRW